MKLLLALSLLVLSGCATQIVKVPVPVKCPVPDISISPLPVDALKGSEDLFVINKALWASIETQEADIVKLKAVVDACR